MGKPITPLLADAPRVLIHVRGTMEPCECDFFERLRFALRESNVELLLTAHYWAQCPIDVPVLRARNGLAAVEPIPEQQGWSPWLINDKLEIPNFQDLLERECQWNGPPTNAEEESQRYYALQHFTSFYSAALKLARPSLVIIWNGQHPQEMILDRLSREYGCAVQYIERGPYQGTLQLDEQGILGGSQVAKHSDWKWPDAIDKDLWINRLREISQMYREGGSTWWPQPPRTDTNALRQKLGIQEGETIVLFAGQVDRDAQCMLFSPYFERNLDAFQWFCDAIPKEKDVFILGKHHPMSPSRPEDYARILEERRGAWVSDIALADCLALANTVAAVNSTVLYEGLMLGLPILALGDSLLSNKNIAYELKSLSSIDSVILEWLAAEDQPDRLNRWEDFGAWLLATRLFSVDSGDKAVSSRSDQAFANTLTKLLIEEPTFPPISLDECFIDSLPLWDDARRHCKRHEGVKEVLRGLNIATEASLGRVAPGTYQWILQQSNRVYQRLTEKK